MFNRKAATRDAPQPNDKHRLSRRDLLKGGTVGLGAILVISGSSIIHPEFAWGLDTSNLKPETMVTLIQLARDIYPHDHIPDRFYAIAVKPYDAKAGEDAETKKLIEDGIADLDKRAGKGGYIGLGWEDDRLAILRKVEDTPFFQTVRGGLVTGLYNQEEIWPLFGYEGESYSKGGYIARGFSDIEWL
ncbi:gluconate 2-dehydrogenase subunit 3 family protein [Phyllobacterium endophyticum]|uniref:Twin-arginine translocation pathway signal n=1 Tax=Phyllobacterium endophyticum TaxID=1149773 RepID=A0A2P7APZ8_9HYPH|nr:Twin-arginine translocation pathway signal [Phyllobacterium endophyticum]TXR47472.1 gluconate 2-dehydrogenase subunit 3 family protein [Phyllobacterium endophyticum]TYR42783.1 gluconate 2-dehydrogenase subunit 3 family protein [Phyllobacterium endophyticum]